MRFVSLYMFLRESINIPSMRCHVLFSDFNLQFIKKVLKSLTGDCLLVVDIARCRYNIYYPLSTLLIKASPVERLHFSNFHEIMGGQSDVSVRGGVGVSRRGMLFFFF